MAERFEQAHGLMTDLGYECESDKGDVWVYRRGSVSIEMHTRIAGNCIFLSREYHFCFLIYHIAKHLSSTGAGIRMFLDIAVFLRCYGKEFDWKQAEELLRGSGLSRTAGAMKTRGRDIKKAFGSVFFLIICSRLRIIC